MNNIVRLPTAIDETSSNTTIAEITELNDADNSSISFDLKAVITGLQVSCNSRDWLLISILATAYKVYAEIESASAQQQLVYLDELEALRFKSGLTTKPRKTYTKIAALIFTRSELDRQLISMYGNVLKNAYLANVTYEGFVDWLDDVGGIDAASRLNRKPREQKAAENMLKYLQYIAPLGKASDEKLSKHVKNTTCEFKLTVSRWNESTGELDIYRIIEDEEVVKAVFAPLADEVKKEAFRALDSMRALSTRPAVKAICLPSAELVQK
jgi:hypothetical protein